MPGILVILILLSLIAGVAAAIGKAPLWVAVILNTLTLMLMVWPK